MRKQLVILYTSTFLFLLLMSSTSQLGFGFGAPKPSMAGNVQPVELLLNETPMAFAAKPFLLKGEVMVPARAFFESISAQVYWYESLNTFVAYKDNIFFKIQVGENQFHLNGSDESMPIQAILYKSEIFVPLRTISQAFDLDFDYDVLSQTVSLNYRQEIYQYREIGYYHYKRSRLLDWGISFYIPEYWEAFEDNYGSFGFIAEYEHYELDTRLLPLDDSFSRVSLLANLQENLIYEHGDNLSITGSKLLQVGDAYASALYYSIMDPESESNRHHILYVIFENNIGYLMTATYTDLNNNPLSREIFDTIISTFEINKVSINSLYEHYMEFNSFYNLGVQLDIPLYSNIQVENQLNFKGRLNHSENVEGFYVLVSKGSDQATYYVPVKDGEFDTTLYTPFGLGKHNLKIFVDELIPPTLDVPEDMPATEAEKTVSLSLDDFIDFTVIENIGFNRDKPLLYFSVVNVSTDSIKNLLPSQFVEFDNPEVYAQSSRLTYNLTSEHAMARAIYDWIYSEYTLEVDAFEGDLTPLNQLIDDDTANTLEIPLLYTGLLRAINIPARVVRGSDDENTTYWAEAYINGKWLIVDLVSDLNNKGSDYEPKGFNVTRTSHYANFIETEVLPF